MKPAGKHKIPQHHALWENKRDEGLSRSLWPARPGARREVSDVQLGDRHVLNPAVLSLTVHLVEFDNKPFFFFFNF